MGVGESQTTAFSLTAWSSGINSPCSAVRHIMVLLARAHAPQLHRPHHHRYRIQGLLHAYRHLGELTAHSQNQLSSHSPPHRSWPRNLSGGSVGTRHQVCGRSTLSLDILALRENPRENAHIFRLDRGLFPALRVKARPIRGLSVIRHCYSGRGGTRGTSLERPFFV